MNHFEKPIHKIYLVGLHRHVTRIFLKGRGGKTAIFNANILIFTLFTWPGGGKFGPPLAFQGGRDLYYFGVQGGALAPLLVSL